MPLTAYDEDDEDGPVPIDDMSDDAVRCELAEAREYQEKADRLIIEWKHAFIDIRSAAYKGDLEEIKRLVREAL